MIIGVPVYDGVDLPDMSGPFEMFHWAGFEIDLLAEAPGLKTTGSGFAFSVPNGLSEARSYEGVPLLLPTLPQGDRGARPSALRPRP